MTTAIIINICMVFVGSISQATITPVQAKIEVERTSLQFFIDQAHPVTGLVRDQAENFVDTPSANHTASMAATGFGLTVVTNAATRGLVTMSFAKDYALKVLRFSRDHVPRRKGWFLHWVDWETGVKNWDSEYSTIDTALFLGGALYAAQIFPNTEVATIAHQLYVDTDFYDAMTDGGAMPNKRTLSMAYYDGQGYTRSQWDMYAEHMLLLILGMGHPTHPLPQDVWLGWDRKPMDIPGAKGVMGMDAALFIHQYSQLFIDFRQFADHFPNYHENGRVLTRVQRTISQVQQPFKTLQEGFWGFSAGQAPNGKYKVFSASDFNSTVCLGCVAGSAMYMPTEILGDITGWMQGGLRADIWGRYGFVDSIDLDQNWYSHQVLGITVGPEYMSLANMDDGNSIWKTFMAIPEIQAGMRSATIASQNQTAKMLPLAKLMKMGLHLIYPGGG